MSGSTLGQFHLDNWTDDDFRAHVPAVRSTIAALLSERTASEAALKEARVVIESLMDIKRGDEFETARAFLAKT